MNNHATYVDDARLDRFLSQQQLADWANESDGQCDAPTGFFALIVNEESDRLEMTDALADELAENDLTFDEVIGNFVITINGHGIVMAHCFPHRWLAEQAYRRLESDYREWEHDGSECIDVVCLTRHDRQFVSRPINIERENNLFSAVSHIIGDWHHTYVGLGDIGPGWMLAMEVGVGSRASWGVAQGMPDVEWLRTHWSIEQDFDIKAEELVGFWTVTDVWPTPHHRHQCVMLHPDKQSMNDVLEAFNALVVEQSHALALVEDAERS